MLSGQFDWGDLLLKGNKFFVALPAGDGRVSIRLYAGISVYLGLRGIDTPAVPVPVTMSRVRTISRKDRAAQVAWYPQRLHAERLALSKREMMIQSVLYGDVERPAEMPGPRQTTRANSSEGVRAARAASE